MLIDQIFDYFCAESWANDIEKIVENLVYQHLIRLGYKVNVGQMYATEIDFVGTKGDDTIYVQASYLISEESTFEREFGNLQKINDNYPKYVISMTPFLDSSKYEGIIHVPLAEFLKKGLSWPFGAVILFSIHNRFQKYWTSLYIEFLYFCTLKMIEI